MKQDFTRGRARVDITGVFERLYARQRDRFILWSPVAFGCGIGWYFSLNTEPSPFIVLPLFLLTLALYIFSRPLKNGGGVGAAYLWLGITVLFLVVGGFTAGYVRTHLLDTTMLQKETRPVTVEGDVESLDWLEEGKGVRLVLENLKIEDLLPEKTPQKIRVKLRDGADLNPGDRISILAKIGPPAAPVAPHAFDFQRYAYFKNIGALGFSFTNPEVILPVTNKGAALWLEDIRQTIGERVRKYVPQPAAGIVTALINGEMAGIAREEHESMRISGLVHMLSISGVHIGLVAGLVFFVTRFLMACFPAFALHHPIKKYAAMIAFAAALFYTFIAGAPIPTIRSMIMTGVVLFAVMVDRVAFSTRLVALAALFVLIFWPESVWGASFQMSFAAVAALVVFFEEGKPLLNYLRQKENWFQRMVFYFAAVSLTTIVASLATAPFSMFHFQQLGLYSLPSNMAVSPIMAFIIMPAGIIACLLMPFGLEQWPLWVMGKGVDMMIAVSRAVSALPYSALTVHAVPLSVLLLVVGGTLFLLFWRGYGKLLAVVPYLAALIIIILHQPPDILVGSEGKLIGLRDRNGALHLSSRVSERFSAENWLRMNGQDPEGDILKWPAEGVDEATGLGCGEGGCRTVRERKNIAFSFHAATHREDCQWADIFIATTPVWEKACESRLVIDKFDIWRNGAYAVWFDGRYENVREIRGDRPWTVTRD